MTNFSWVAPREGVIDARKLAGGVVLVLRAQDERRTATGPHAKITVGLANDEGSKQGVTILSDVFNTDKEDYRHNFVNILYGTPRRKAKFKLDFMEAFPRDEFEADFDDFCEQYHSHLVGDMRGGWVAGDTDKSSPQFYVDGLVLKDGGTIMYAQPKSAKSYTCMLLAVSINAGIQDLWAVERARPLYINLERGEQSMRRRLGLVNRVLGLPAPTPLLMLNKRGRTLADVYDAAAAMVEQEQVDIVFLDSLTRGGFGDLNGNEEANRAMDYLNRLCPAWVAIAHTPRSDDSHIFGSQMFDAAMDIGVAMRKQRKPDGTLGVGFHVKDTNDTGVPPLRILAYEFDQYGLSGVREADPMEFPEVEDPEGGAGHRNNAERVYAQFVAFGKSSATVVAHDLAMNAGTVSAEIKKLVSAGKLIELGKEDRKILYGVPNTNYEAQR